jgi:3-methyladenine DNA glycosylase AlkD
MTLKDLLTELQPLASEKTAKIYTRLGVKETILGVNKGPLRKLAESLGVNESLAKECWESNIFEARIIAITISDPSTFTPLKVETWVSQSESLHVTDELCFTWFEAMTLGMDQIRSWIDHPSLRHQRLGWNLAIVKVHRKKLNFSDLRELIDRIEVELPNADPLIQDAMNRCLVEISVTYPQFTEEGLALGERLGVYKEVKVAKGCTSPYAPDWIHAVLRRNSKD